jgi:hypothetical protein
MNSHWAMIGSSLLRGPLGTDGGALVPPTRAALDALIKDTMFPSELEIDGDPMPRPSLGEAKPRHVVIVSLETAVENFYPIVDNPDFPSFQRMSQNAIVSDKHHTVALRTAEAGFSMLTGLYTTENASYSSPVPDSLPGLLGGSGYIPTYIDTGLLDWRGGDGHRRMFSSAGFGRLIEASAVPGLWENRREYEGKIRLEEWGFDLVAQSLLEADAEGQKALIFLQSSLGHFPWPARPEEQQLGSVERLHGVAAEMDKLMGRLLERLEEAGLGEDIIIVVTGDHGLRYRGEFESLGLRLSVSDVAFNVPLIIYAPGLIENQLAMPYVTSHIDLTPTILELIGLPTEGLLHHGMSMFDPRLASRVTFMMPVGLSPVSGFHWHGWYFTYNSLTSKALVSREFRGPKNAVGLDEEGANLGIPALLRRASEVIEEAAHFIDLTYVYLEEDRTDTGSSK